MEDDVAQSVESLTYVTRNVGEGLPVVTFSGCFGTPRHITYMGWLAVRESRKAAHQESKSRLIMFE
jgi:hypothetical protein